MENQQRHDLTTRFTKALELIVEQAYANIIDEWQAQELTVLQVRIMETLHRQGPNRMGEISNTLGHNLSAATSLIDRLVDKGMVQRSTNPADRRVVRCELTDKGRETIQRLMGVSERAVNAIITTAEPEQLEAMVIGIELLVAHMESTESEDAI